MRDKMSAKEKVVRYMAETRKIGEWFYTYELAGKFILGQNTGTDADTRLYSILNDDGGIYRSRNFNYEIERRRIGKYTEFRIKRKTLKVILGLKDWTNEEVMERMGV